MRPGVFVRQPVRVPVVSPLGLPVLALMLGVPTSLVPAVVVATDDVHVVIGIDGWCPVDDARRDRPCMHPYVDGHRLRGGGRRREGERDSKSKSECVTMHG